MEEKFKFSDELIAKIAQCLQLAMLTGTDVMDHFRMIEVMPKEGKLVPTEEWVRIFEDTIDKLHEVVDAHNREQSGPGETVGDC